MEQKYRVPWGGGVGRVLLGGAVWLGSPSPDPTSDQNM